MNLDKSNRVVTFTIEITEAMKFGMEKLIANGLYKDESELVRDALRHLLEEG